LPFVFQAGVVERGAMPLFALPLCSMCCTSDGASDVIGVEEGLQRAINESAPFFESGTTVEEEDSEKADEEENFVAKKLPEWWLPRTPGFFKLNGVHLHVRHFLPDEASKLRGTIFYVHGLKCHVNRPSLAILGNALTTAGFSMLTFDLMGNGYSEGLRDYVEDLEDVFRSVLRFVQIVMTEGHSDTDFACTGELFDLGISDDMLNSIRSLPYFFLGESMGGILAMYSSIRLKQASPPWLSRHHGVVLVAPALAVKVPPKEVVMLLKSVVVPLASKDMIPQAVSNLPAGQSSHVLWAAESAFAAMALKIDDDMKDVDCPLLVLHDPNDEVAKVDGSRRLVQIAASQDKELVECPGATHNVISNKLHLFMGKVLPWLVQRC